MEDIYNDLENYDDVNALQELRKENKELQLQLEENRSQLIQLQKDYDKVSADLKALKANYSSLWKTAKAEIDRKTQIINSLNAEKDKIILSSIQNSSKSMAILRRNRFRGIPNNRKVQKDDLDSVKPNKKDVPEVKKHEPDKNDENRVPTPDSGSSQGQTDDSNKVVNSDNKISKEPYDKTSESKENAAKGKKALSLKHRRKSMPVLNASTISSDEEYEDGCSDNTSKRERPSREDNSRKYFDRHKLIHKISETSGIDEKFSSCHESSRETFYKNRFSGKYRIPRDKSRNRKHFSPESRRGTKEYHKDEREVVIRHNRVLVSPPRDSYDPLRQFRERIQRKYGKGDDRRSRRDEFEEDRNTRKDDFYEERHDDLSDKKYNKPRYGFREERLKKRDDSHEERTRQKQRDNSHEERTRQKQRDDSHEERARQKHAYEVKRQKQKDTFAKERRDSSQEDRNRDLYEIEKQSSERQKHKNSFEKQKHVQRYSSQDDRNDLREVSREENHVQKVDPNKELHETHEDRINAIDAKVTPKDRVNEEKQLLDRHEDRKRKERSKSRENPHKQIKPMMIETSIDGDEPSSKRARIDSDSKPTEEDHKPKKQTIVEQKLLPEFAKHMHQNSCQSPDNPPIDAPPVISTSNKPKEIIHTSSTYLEDPRHTSNKYVKVVEGHKIVITTAVGRNVDLIPIDISTWKSPRSDMQETSQNPQNISVLNPDQYTDEMVRDIYMDVENPNSDLSMSAETESNDLRMADYLTKNFQQEYENERINQIEANADKQVEKVGHRDSINEKYVQKDNVKEKESTIHPVERKLPPVRYKLSRETTTEPAPNPLGVLLQQFQTVCGVDATTKPPEPKLSVDETFSTDDDTQNKKEKVKVKNDESADGRQLRRRKMSAKELVEGDLALSDETSDNVVSQKQTKKGKVKEQPSSKNENVPEPEIDTVKPGKNNEKKTRKSKADKKQKKEETSPKEGIEIQLEDKTNKKSRKKSVTKQMATTVTEVQSTMDEEKKTKGRKPKLSTGKFPELFGDSSSLITPEDLGVITEAPTDKSNKYVHIFEDAQDSVDVNVAAMKNAELALIQPPVTSSKAEEPARTAENKPTSLICKIRLQKSATFIDENNDSAPISVQKSISPTSNTEKRISVSVSVQQQEAAKSKPEKKESAPTKNDNEHVLVPTAVQNPIEATSEIDNNDTAPTSVQNVISTANKNDSASVYQKPTSATTEHETNVTAPVVVQKITPNIQVSNAIEITDPDVIKTVIISTGIQPRIEEPQTSKLADKIETIVRTSVTKINEAIPIALATSTPHKNLLHQLHTEIECSRSCTSSEQHESSRDDRSSMSNGISADAQNDDVPDVRIFVRRRRRLKK